MRYLITAVLSLITGLLSQAQVIVRLGLEVDGVRECLDRFHRIAVQRRVCHQRPVAMAQGIAAVPIDAKPADGLFVGTGCRRAGRCGEQLVVPERLGRNAPPRAERDVEVRLGECLVAERY